MNLDELLGESTSRARGCYVCGKKNAAAVSLRLLEVAENGQVAKGGRSVSRTKSFCADHAAVLFQELRERLEKQT